MREFFDLVTLLVAQSEHGVLQQAPLQGGGARAHHLRGKNTTKASGAAGNGSALAAHHRRLAARQRGAPPPGTLSYKSSGTKSGDGREHECVRVHACVCLLGLRGDFGGRLDGLACVCMLGVFRSEVNERT